MQTFALCPSAIMLAAVLCACGSDGDAPLAPDAGDADIPPKGGEPDAAPARDGASEDGDPAVGSGVRAKAISVGQSFACALMEDATVRCWGGTIYGTVRAMAGQEPVATMAVPGLSGVAAISAGSNFVCALLDTGKVMCWGDNQNGQIGQDFYTTTAIAVPSEIPGVSGATAIACGGGFACAVQDGTVTCWGANSRGMLGNGTRSGVGTPIPATVMGLKNVTSLATSTALSVCAVAGGNVICWGDNAMPDRSSSNLPIAVAGLSGIKELALGIGYTCAVTADDRLSCWGVPPDTKVETLTPTPVAGLMNVQAAAASGHGDTFACALLRDGTARCWGKNNAGQLGDGTDQDSMIPVTVTDLTQAVAIDVGERFACALIEDGSVRCWGNNYAGQLGDGTTEPSAVPVSVAF